MASLRLERLAKRYAEGTQALRPLSLTVPDGELLVVMGPSGCGKSTLLRLIAGLEVPSEGRVWLGGTDVTDVQPAQRDVAMVFQDYALYPHMTVAENLAFGLRMRKMPRADRDARVRQVSEQLGIAHLRDRRPRQLSGGEQQRVALGRALVRRPQLFLLDEPLSNLDASRRGVLRDEVRRLHAATGVTMLYVTHDQQEALSLAQRLAVLRDGTLLQVGAPEVLYATPANLAVAQALGHPSINWVTGVVTLERGVPRLATDAGMLPLPAWSATAELPDRVTLAVRPEHVTLAPGGAAGALTLAMEVDGVEGAGPDKVAWLRWGPLRWAARLDPARPAPVPGDALAVHVDVEAAHLFAGDDGPALRPRAA